MPDLDRETKMRILEAAHEAMDRGDEAEWMRLSLQLPMAPHIAKAAKETMGAEYVRNSGFNLSLAEEKYGQNWLDN